MEWTRAYNKAREQLTGASASIRALLKVGVLAGFLVAVLVFPLVGAAGLSTKSAVDAVDQLSKELGNATPPQATYVYAADGTTPISQFYDEFRRNVPLEEIPPVMQQAMIATEDGRFYSHNGVDPRGVARAMVANKQSGEVSQGASTLTMQYVRGALRTNADSIEETLAATEESAPRKIREMRLAVATEEQLSKKEILERYLNQVYFGHQAYGIYAASYVYYSTTPDNLTLAQAATLAGLVQAPSAYDPASPDNTEAATKRRNHVLDRMSDLGHITASEAKRTKDQPIELDLSRPSNSCMDLDDEAQKYGFVCDYVRNWWRSNSQFGETEQERENDLRRGGYTIITSINPKAQESAVKEVESNEDIHSQYAHGVVSIEPGTGRVQTMAVNRHFALDQSDNGPHSLPAAQANGAKGNYPNTVNPLLGGGDVPGYQAGSTFKMFTMLAALEDGMDLDTHIQSPNKVTTKYPVGAGPASCGGYWCPSNASKSMAGNHTMWSGFGQSVNTYFAQLIQKVGAAKAVKMAERLGLQWRSESDAKLAKPENADGWGAFTLGVADTSPLEMANAYATIAADGVYCSPTPVLKAVDADGNEVEGTAPDCHRELSKDVARAGTDAARCVTGYKAAKGSCGGNATAPGFYNAVKRPVAGKTGTTDSDRAAWFVGYTPQLAAASFMADPDNPFHAVGSGNAQKPIDAVAETLRKGLDGKPKEKFTPPSSKMT